MASTRKHPANCEKADGHVCKCKNCSGSKHGWKEWVGLARGPERARSAKRAEIKKKWLTWTASKRGVRRNARARESSMDSFRLDLSDWLARHVWRRPNIPAQRREAELLPVEREESDQAWSPGTESGQQVCSEEPQRSGGILEEYPGHPAPVEQVDALAKAMTEGIWPDVLAELGTESEDLGQVRLQLADHGWCDLIIGFVKVIEEANGLIDQLSEAAKKVIVDTVVDSSRKDPRSQLTREVVGMIVDKAWGALKTAVLAHVPILELITSDELLRDLRILAVFICPAPEAHEEVREHAVTPLLEDARGYVSEETKKWLAQQFDQWVTGTERRIESGRRGGEAATTRPSSA
ncbi:hypothetical protein [Amycolatopsis sp. DG1A-15b]|uniref:hypothetical protein n=1 Tax=Amycolatopsis sp. DG1A-15b TaxID=3052846 RepID=UPI00255C04B9|nr:hypothetical protein [Amycolatopsis sp. DG1A-15b]WIX87937.1 hypothetical protein QRY02_43520 [Amycolatopsis sp. DG1A-15b]